MRERDLESFIEYEAEVSLRGEYVPIPLRSEPEIRARFARDGYWGDDGGLLLITSNEDDRIVGQVVCSKPNRFFDALEVGYYVYQQADRNRGIGAEALGLLTTYLFQARNEGRIQLLIEPENIASRRVAEKVGFKLDGVLREALIRRGVPRDLMCWSMLRREQLNKEKGSGD